MNKKEALAKAIIEGVKIRCSGMLEEEYIFWDGNGFCLSDVHQSFFNMKEMPRDEWRVFIDTFDKTEAIKEIVVNNKSVRNKNEPNKLFYYNQATREFNYKGKLGISYSANLNDYGKYNWYQN